MIANTSYWTTVNFIALIVRGLSRSFHKDRAKLDWLEEEINQ
jgi:hypothetical protein